MVAWLTRWFYGFVTVIIEGYFCEKFINLCLCNGLHLWDVKKTSRTTIKAKMRIDDFKRTPPFVHKTKCSIRIKGKHGFPFMLFRYRKRKMFVGGIILAIVLVSLMGSFVWQVEIVGSENIPKELLYSQLEQCGLKTGLFKAQVDGKKIAYDMMLRMEELSWITVDVKGTKAYVFIKERKMPPVMVPKDKPCHIIATKDGIIKTMVTKDGVPVVKKGETVKKGDLLVSGIIESVKTNTMRYVHAVSEVEARTWYEKKSDISIVQEKKVKTGKIAKKRTLQIFQFPINLFVNSSISYEKYDKITYRKQITIGEHYALPLILTTDKYDEYVVEEEKITPEEAVAKRTEELSEEIKKEIPEGAKVVSPLVEHIFKDERTISVRVVLECLENIGVQEEIKQ